MLDYSRFKEMLKMDRSVEIENKFIPFIRDLSDDDKLKLAQLAVEENITDIRILKAIEKNTGINVIDEIVANDPDLKKEYNSNNKY